MKVELTHDTVSHEDMDALAEWIKTYPHLTQGKLVSEFETRFAYYAGSKYAVFVNSGSSAILLMLSAVKGLLNNDKPKVVVPCLSWATDLAPVIQLGFEPILVDCNLHNLGPDIRDLERIFIEEKPDIILLVSVLGLVPDYDEIISLCKEYNVLLLEDACESLGSYYHHSMIGTIGGIGAYSFFYSHHISTIEGGMLVTDSDYIYEKLLMMRSHGWSRDLSLGKQDELRQKYNISSFKNRFTFYELGYNIRNTDLQAFLGMRQLSKLTNIRVRRSQNYARYHANLEKYTWTPIKLERDFVSSFGMPIIDEKSERIISKLQLNDIQCRPLICGSMGQQPMWIKYNGEPTYKQNADLVHKHGIYVPNHVGMGTDEVDYVCNVIKEAINE